MSLLSSFKSDFNRKISVRKQKSNTFPNGEVIKERTKNQENIPCLIMLNDAKYNQTLGIASRPNQMEYLKASHTIRLEFWPQIEKGNRIEDDKGQKYQVEFVYATPWFGGEDDHLLLYVETLNE